MRPMLKSFFALFLFVYVVTGCSHTQSTSDTMARRAHAQHTTVVIVPGSGAQPAALWKTPLEEAGYDVATYEKRVGSNGPLMLAKDLDQACDNAKRHFGYHQGLLLWTAEQGTQVVLNAKCLKEARALVIISPIPDSLDRVWVSALREAGLRNRAESLSATFDSIRKGFFEPNAKIMGASLSFWKEWMMLAQKTPAQLEALTLPTLFVVGEKDVLMGRFGRHVLERIVGKNKNRKVLIIKDADRNLLQNGTLSQNTVEIILKTLGVLENNNGY